MNKKLKIQNSKVQKANPSFILPLFKGRDGGGYIFLLLFCSSALYSFCLPAVLKKEKVYRKSKVLMDTLITISVVSGSGDKAEKAIDKAFGEIEKLDRLLNFSLTAVRLQR